MMSGEGREVTTKSMPRPLPEMLALRVISASACTISLPISMVMIFASDTFFSRISRATLCSKAARSS